ncbi:hypothetical protein GCM10022225_11660 [Plantactinospora mayteni]|uniref:YdhG-like domain-containing protein n=1 Tax=Plantactinospora mayteni TaxID=566021 RepID=A0ABQ4EIQ7_9ACTN|nr:DUF1801 domain-containing protein [Plantactinospora mayteni]GIG94082.1 hypothetical protein Pma05_06550 [Plantactinospora mayteni]
MPKTAPTEVSVDDFLAALPDEQRRADADRLRALLRDVTGEEPVMWGPSIVGFGRYHYRYPSGHQGDAPLVGFSPRRQHLVVYLVGGFEQRYAATLARLGPHKTGKGCLYLKSLAGVDETALRELVDRTARVHRGVDTATG